MTSPTGVVNVLPTPVVVSTRHPSSVPTHPFRLERRGPYVAKSGRQGSGSTRGKTSRPKDTKGQNREAEE